MKDKLLDLQNEFAEERMKTGRRRKMNEGSLKQQCIQERDDFMAQNLGGFEKIFPSKDPEI